MSSCAVDTVAVIRKLNYFDETEEKTQNDEDEDDPQNEDDSQNGDDSQNEDDSQSEDDSQIGDDSQIDDDSHVFLDSWDEKLNLRLCKPCLKPIKSAYESACKQLWSQLPGFFGLQPWDELKDFDM